MSIVSWTPEEDAALLLVWPSVMPIADVVTQVGRSVHAVRRRAQILKVRRPHQKPHKRPPAGPFWRVPGCFELALEMSQAGVPASEIARRLGCTKNAVIGRLFRTIGSRNPKRPVIAFEERLARYPEPKGCRYIAGDVRRDGIHWCDAPITVFGRSYCDEHHAICWQKAES